MSRRNDADERRSETDQRGADAVTDDWQDRHARTEGRRSERCVRIDRTREDWDTRHCRTRRRE